MGMNPQAFPKPKPIEATWRAADGSTKKFGVGITELPGGKGFMEVAPDGGARWHQPPKPVNPMADIIPSLTKQFTTPDGGFDSVGFNAASQAVQRQFEDNSPAGQKAIM